MSSWDTALCVLGGGGEVVSRRWWVCIEGVLRVYCRCIYISVYIYICRWIFSRLPPPYNTTGGIITISHSVQPNTCYVSICQDL